MTNQDYTHIIVVLDRSGSMGFIQDETQQALNNFVDEQKQLPGEATLSYYTFNDHVRSEFVRKSLPEVEGLKLDPSGLTALHDAMGRAIETEGRVLAKLSEDERPGKVILVTITDGAENASQEHNAATVKKLVERQTNDYGWDFVFLGANQDAVLTAAQFGISKDSTLTYAATGGGISNSSGLVSSYVTTTRAGGRAFFTDADRVAALDADATV